MIINNNQQLILKILHTFSIELEPEAVGQTSRSLDSLDSNKWLN